MFASIEKGVALFKNELREYVRYTNNLKAQYPGSPETFHDRIGKEEHTRLVCWYAKLEGMKMALGLDKTEISVFYREAGIEKVKR